MAIKAWCSPALKHGCLHHHKSSCSLSQASSIHQCTLSVETWGAIPMTEQCWRISEKCSEKEFKILTHNNWHWVWLNLGFQDVKQVYFKSLVKLYSHIATYIFAVLAFLRKMPAGYIGNTRSLPICCRMVSEHLAHWNWEMHAEWMMSEHLICWNCNGYVSSWQNISISETKRWKQQKLICTK
jgi:hypothetical protein